MLTIRQRQLNLKTYMYYYKGNIDGVEGSLTKNAYMNFQSNNGLKKDGIYGSNTENKLILCIKDIQRLLNKFGYNLDVDGLVGNKTIAAIRDFQSKNSLVVDGIVGEKTLAKLSSNNYTWNDIKNFKKSEFTCNCGCGLNNINLQLVRILDQIRDDFNSPLIITSGCRCKSWNAKVGGVQGSKHVLGKAADFYIKGVPVSTTLNYCESLVKKGIIRYTYTNSTNMSGAVHIDIV